MQELKEKLTASGIQFSEFENTLNLVYGKGIHANRLNLDPEKSSQMTDREFSFYVRGIHQILSQPKKSIAKKWNFKLSAGSLLPSVETLAFVRGVEDAAGSPAFHLELIDDLVLCYGVRWDRGIHIVTDEQFLSWNVSKDRVRAAARSMLYHHSEYVKWEESETHSTFVKGDGSDAARFTILEDKFFGEIGPGFRFALPSPDLLLGNFNPSNAAAFSEQAASLFEKQDAPLSPDVYAFVKGKIAKVEL